VNADRTEAFRFHSGSCRCEWLASASRGADDVVFAGRDRVDGLESVEVVVEVECAMVDDAEFAVGREDVRPAREEIGEDGVAGVRRWVRERAIAAIDLRVCRQDVGPVVECQVARRR
jgi:hypothetical protein